VAGRRPLAVRSAGRVAKGQPLFVIGHPNGLPTKFADGAQVRGNAHKDFFVANLDTYGGNSGSPVFNAVSLEVEGILVRGENDFVRRGGVQGVAGLPRPGLPRRRRDAHVGVAREPFADDRAQSETVKPR
jgi:hypothetical protein